jgi:hypothetical protein
VNGEKSGDGDDGSGGDSEGSAQEPIELDERSEEELSILWDMSTNEDVMAFLYEIKAMDLFETIITRTNSPRFAVSLTHEYCSCGRYVLIECICCVLLVGNQCRNIG